MCIDEDVIVEHDADGDVVVGSGSVCIAAVADDPEAEADDEAMGDFLRDGRRGWEEFIVEGCDDGVRECGLRGAERR